MSELPVREMVLYKHGVGFFVREGAVAGEMLALTFRRDEINDVLKSLAVFDKAGGQVLGIHYRTPMNPIEQLANSSIQLSDAAGLRDLLRGLRGRQAALHFETTPGTVETVEGRVIGLDEQKPQEDRPPDLVSVLAEDGQVRVFRFDALRAVDIHDTQSKHDLSYCLDVTTSEGARRTITVRLSQGEHEIVVYYVAPSPTWRVSYRLVADSDENGQTGKGLLQGWGLFDNRLEEDLEHVQVTLVAGQPISFIYELYASRIPTRPTVQDESRIAPGPVDWLADELTEADLAPAQAPAARAVSSAPQTRGMRAGGLLRRIDSKVMAQAAPPTAETKESGEFFQYIVTAPVSVKRGESALVPIIGSQIAYDRELLYNGAKLPDHPVASLRFENNTGLTLERGPVTVVENGDYKGEAIVPFTKDQNQVYLPYAVELGVHILERPKHHTETVGLNIKDEFLVFEEYHIQEVTYVLENTTAKPLTITIEAPIQTNLELFDTRPADAETRTDRRWRVSVAARARTEFIRKERQRNWRKEQLRNLNYQNLLRFLENRWLDKATFDRLSEMLDNLASIQYAKTRQDNLTTERETIYEKQEQLRANLGALQPTGKEAALRDRLLGQLETSQARLEEIEKEFEEASRQITEAEKKVEQIIAGME